MEEIANEFSFVQEGGLQQPQEDSRNDQPQPSLLHSKHPTPILRQTEQKNPIATYEKCFKTETFKKSTTGVNLKPASRKIAPHKKKPFSCEICQRPFQTRFARKQHVNSHRKKGKYQCKKCQKGFSTALFSACHQEVCHSTAKVPGWETHREGFKQSKYMKLLSAKRSTLENVFLCEVCGRGFSCFLNLSEHKRQHNGERPFTCLQCYKRFPNTMKLRRHKLQHAEQRHFRCYLCWKNFSRLALLKLHSSVHAKGIADECEILVAVHTEESKKIRRKKNVRSGKSHQCPMCSKTFKYVSELKVHLLSHGEKPYACDVCNRGFARQDTLITHKRTHTREKPFTCEDCGKSFGQASSLSKHQMVHTGAKPYICDICHRKFSQSSNMRAHKKTHFGERPFKCEVCSKCFTRPFGLKMHQRSHTGEKPYECDICQKRFAQQYFVRRHRLIHTGEKPFACELCGRKFNQSSVLVSHMRTHTGEEPYVCKVCNRGFKQSTGLKTHQKIHNMEHSFKCQVCLDTFPSRHALGTHAKQCSVTKLKRKQSQGDELPSVAKVKPCGTTENQGKADPDASTKVQPKTNQQGVKEVQRIPEHKDGKNTSLQSQAAHASASTLTFYMCDLCQCFFKTISTYRAHLQHCYNTSFRSLAEQQSETLEVSNVVYVQSDNSGQLVLVQDCDDGVAISTPQPQNTKVGDSVAQFTDQMWVLQEHNDQSHSTSKLPLDISDGTFVNELLDPPCHDKEQQLPKS